MIVDAVIVAAGGSTRFGEDKLRALLCGKTVLERSLAAFAASESIAGIVVVTTPERRAWVEQLAARVGDHGIRIVDGGERRRDSVQAGLLACTTEYVAIHDGARPLVTGSLIAAVVNAATGVGGAIPAVAVTDTVKEVAGEVVLRNPERSSLRAAQTPQCVHRQSWLAAAAADDADETDDAAMLARLGRTVAVVEGDPANMKITLPWDIATAEAILRHRGDCS